MNLAGLFAPVHPSSAILPLNGRGKNATEGTSYGRSITYTHAQLLSYFSYYHRLTGIPETHNLLNYAQLLLITVHYAKPRPFSIG